MLADCPKFCLKRSISQSLPLNTVRWYTFCADTKLWTAHLQKTKSCLVHVSFILKVLMNFRSHSNFNILCSLVNVDPITKKSYVALKAASKKWHQPPSWVHVQSTLCFLVLSQKMCVIYGKINLSPSWQLNLLKGWHKRKALIKIRKKKANLGFILNQSPQHHWLSLTSLRSFGC